MFSTWIGVVLLFALFGLIALVVVRAAPRGNSYEKKRAETRFKKLEDAQKENAAALNSYSWGDKTKGIARIPINDAMKLTLAELAQKKPTAAGPIAAESPGPAPAANANPSAAPVSNATPPPAASPAPTSSGGHEPEHQPAATSNPPAAPPKTQPGANSSPAASAPPASAKSQVSPSPSVGATPPGTPLPVRGKTP